MTTTRGSRTGLARLFRSPDPAGAITDQDERTVRDYAARHPLAPPGAEIELSVLSDVALAFESCVLVPHTGICIRGWLSDPGDQVRSTWLQIGEEFRRLTRITHTYRPDIIGARQLFNSRPGYRAGFTAIEPWEITEDQAVVARFIAVVETAGGMQVVSSRRSVKGDNRSIEYLLKELNAHACSPRDLTRLSRPVLQGISAPSRRMAWRDKRVEKTGNGGGDLTIVIVTHCNAEMLPHILAFLETQAARRRLNVVIVGRDPARDPEIRAATRQLRGTMHFASLKAVSPANPVTFGAAVKEGVELAEDGPVLVMSDEHLPPERPWVDELVARVRQQPETIHIPQVMTFDGRAHGFDSGLTDLPLDAYDEDHSEVAAHIRDVVSPNFIALGCGVFAADRKVLTQRYLFDLCLTVPDISLADMIWRATRKGAARVSPYETAFTFLALSDYSGGDPVERLVNAYVLAANTDFTLTRQATGPAPPPPGQKPALETSCD